MQMPDRRCTRIMAELYSSSKYCNFFVFANCVFRFSEVFCLYPIRWFPGSFAKSYMFLGVSFRAVSCYDCHRTFSGWQEASRFGIKMHAIKSRYARVTHPSLRWRLFGLFGLAPRKSTGTENSPEINELDTDKKLLKIWMHNFEKQKS